METLSVDKHCEMLTSQILERISAIQQSFNLYAQMFSAILGGAVVLRLQYEDKMTPNFACLADVLATLIFINAVVTILRNAYSCQKYREKLSDTAGVDKSGQKIIPLPNAFYRNCNWIVMLSAMVVAQVLFYCFNPLRP